MDLSTVRARPARTFAAALAAAIVAAGCALGTGGAPAEAPRLPGVSDRTGSSAVCSGDLQSCEKGETCCNGLTCAPHGRFGMLCRRPAVGGS